MARGARRSLIVVAGLACALGVVGAAASAPVAGRRVVLADPDRELRTAMEQALAPWHLEIVIGGEAPRAPEAAQHQADAATARFVVWREANELVVYDRALGSTERRASLGRALDPLAAAAAALTIKTMMRLPPPDDAEPVAPPAVTAEPRPALRLQAGLATRIASGDATLSVRIAGAVAVRPWAGAAWRFGLAADRGTATSVSRASFKGEWSDWAVLAIASWSYDRDTWELEPLAGVGLRRATLDGSEMSTPRTEATTLAAVRAGITVRRRVGRWSFGVAGALDAVFGTPTYTKTGAPAEIFQVPDAAVELGAAITAEL